jgi:N-acyl-D-aspartate/D-glutamate deacylase
MSGRRESSLSRREYGSSRPSGEYLFRFKDRGVLREGYWADIVLSH